MLQEADRTALVELLLEQRVLMFGEFTLKSGRVSPYFFNLGAIHDGAAIASLGEAYARGLQHSGLAFQSVFGPAYKGIPIAVATAQALARSGHNVGWSFNRKEPKAHGEGGQFVGAPLQAGVVAADAGWKADQVDQKGDLSWAPGKSARRLHLDAESQESHDPRAHGKKLPHVSCITEDIGH